MIKTKLMEKDQNSNNSERRRWLREKKIKPGVIKRPKCLNYNKLGHLLKFTEGIPLREEG